jgi:hypothetical protein
LQVVQCQIPVALLESIVLKASPVIPVTFAANACVEASTKFLGQSPPKAGYMSPPSRTNTGVAIRQKRKIVSWGTYGILLIRPWCKSLGRSK